MPMLRKDPTGSAMADSMRYFDITYNEVNSLFMPGSETNRLPKSATKEQVARRIRLFVEGNLLIND